MGAEEAPDALAIQVYKQMGFLYPKFYKMDALSKYGWLAAELLLGSERVNNEDAYLTAQVFQNASSSLCTDRLFAQSMDRIASPALFVYTLPNIVMGEIAIRHGLKGENTFFITEAFDAEQLVSYASQVLQDGMAHRVICGRLELNENGVDVLCCLVEASPQDALAPFDAKALNLLYAAR